MITGYVKRITGKVKGRGDAVKTGKITPMTLLDYHLSLIPIYLITHTYISISISPSLSLYLHLYIYTNHGPSSVKLVVRRFLFPGRIYSLYLGNLAMTASGKFNVSLTTCGGVRPSHWATEISVAVARGCQFHLIIFHL